MTFDPVSAPITEAQEPNGTSSADLIQTPDLSLPGRKGCSVCFQHILGVGRDHIFILMSCKNLTKTRIPKIAETSKDRIVRNITIDDVKSFVILFVAGILSKSKDNLFQATPSVVAPSLQSQPNTLAKVC